MSVVFRAWLVNICKCQCSWVAPSRTMAQGAAPGCGCWQELACRDSAEPVRSTDTDTDRGRHRHRPAQGMGRRQLQQKSLYCPANIRFSLFVRLAHVRNSWVLLWQERRQKMRPWAHSVPHWLHQCLDTTESGTQPELWAATVQK